MILLTGTTGTVGRHLLGYMPTDQPFRVLAREPERVEGVPRAARVVRGDYGDRRSLAVALDGVRTAFLVTNRIGDDDRSFLRAARRAGVRRVVKLSAAAVADRQADDLITRWQRTSEGLLRTSGMEWTLLRPRSFMSNALSWASSVRGERVVRALYGGAANACVDPRDVAEVAARALTEDGHAGRVHTLTGPEALTTIEQTAQLGEVLGRRLRFEGLSRQQARGALLERYPADVAEALLDSAERMRQGAKAGVEGTVERLLGRPPGSFRGWAAAHRAAFAAPVERVGC
ncbi:NAD(P)H-binding protein [Streptomyces sp. NPDC012888]|uniref:NAD(P)H-binding protein n=1 Tax=Streptomyces sp. NPDC012888 TaxID=3364855 RepID=UPI003679E084